MKRLVVLFAFLLVVCVAYADDKKFVITSGFHIVREDQPPKADPPTVSKPAEDEGEYQDPNIHYMDSQTERAWINALPKQGDDDLIRILSRKLIPYDHNVLPRINQDAAVPANGTESLVWDGNYNPSATNHPIGSPTRDPQWRTTAGFPESTKVMHYLVFPNTGSIDVWRARAPNGRTYNLVYHRFPVGMTVVEAGFNRVDGEDLCFEIRTRTKVSDGYGVEHWRPNRYVPCRTPEELDEAITRVEGKPSLLGRMLKPSHYYNDRLSFTFARFENTKFEREAFQVKLPKMDQKTVAGILKTTPFRSTLDQNWEDFANGTCAAPTTDEEGQLYPVDYKGAFFPTSMKSCRKCHEDDNKHTFDDLGPGDWYGYVPGSDGIRSWTPIQPVYGGVQRYPSLDSRLAGSSRITNHGLPTNKILHTP